MSFHRFFIIVGQTHFAWAKDEWSFEAHAPYLRESFDRGTKATQLIEFDYSTTATKSNWEPRGVLQPEQKIKDLAKGEKMQHLQRLQRGRRRNK
ncbi:hypothetical protein BHE74_00050640 [Ensete ventricosum]|nr:hypothetical protein BHE74_00050640 [Ensete ventricosum]